jgi:RsiW-degrading membrane proteinase PrsW (M82 family)
VSPVLVAALTEEMAKYLVGRRFRRLDGKGIGCHGVIACVSSAALGLAATEHVMYSVGYISTNGILGGLFSSVLRAVIAIPLHVGTVRLSGSS